MAAETHRYTVDATQQWMSICNRKEETACKAVDTEQEANKPSVQTGYVGNYSKWQSK
jgi:hypothetical protein